jgi:hypothetical protein
VFFIKLTTVLIPKVTQNQVVKLFFGANPFAEKAKGRAIRATW